jgi:hypothetical protein
MTKEEKKNLASVLQMERTLIDQIYNACVANSKNFKVDYTPVAYVDLICDLAWQSLETQLTLSMARMEKPEEKKMIGDNLRLNETLLNSIKGNCKKNADSFHVDYVPLKFLKLTCDNAFKVVEKGLKGGN